MHEHFLILRLSEETAALRRKDGSEITVPSSWLPEGARPGNGLICELTPHGEASCLTLSLAEGTSKPQGTDVGA